MARCRRFCVELHLFKQMLAMGATLLGEFFTSVGLGDLGQALTLLHGDVVKRSFPSRGSSVVPVGACWANAVLNRPNWSHHSHGIALSARLAREALLLHAMFNAYGESLEFGLPAGAWRRWIDTSLNSAEDMMPWRAAPPVVGQKYDVEARSVVVLSASTDGSDRATVECFWDRRKSTRGAPRSASVFERRNIVGPSSSRRAGSQF